MHGIAIHREKLLARLKRIEGQIRGIHRMVDEDEYCINIITQTSAVKSAISALENEMLSAHLSHCVKNIPKTGDMKKLTDEILKVYSLKRR
jgi:DNA-binding FrmR family transcriptional regulator